MKTDGKATRRYAASLAKPNLWLVLGAVALAAGSAYAAAQIPVMLGRAIDALLAGRRVSVPDLAVEVSVAMAV
jgi:hypothetical protein